MAYVSAFMSKITIGEHPLRTSPREGEKGVTTVGTEGVKVNKDVPFKY